MKLMVHNVTMNTMHKNNQSSFALPFSFSKADTYLVEIFSQPHSTNVQLGLMWQVGKFLPKPRYHETFQNSASSNLGGGGGGSFMGKHGSFR